MRFTQALVVLVPFVLSIVLGPAAHAAPVRTILASSPCAVHVYSYTPPRVAGVVTAATPYVNVVTEVCAQSGTPVTPAAMAAHLAAASHQALEQEPSAMAGKPQAAITPNGVPYPLGYQFAYYRSLYCALGWGGYSTFLVTSYPAFSAGFSTFTTIGATPPWTGLVSNQIEGWDTWVCTGQPSCYISTMVAVQPWYAATVFSVTNFVAPQSWIIPMAQGCQPVYWN